MAVSLHDKQLPTPGGRSPYTTAPDTHSLTSPVSSKASSTSTLVEETSQSKVPQLSTCKLFFAHLGAAMTLFLATTDATIVSTILPSIAGQYNASQLEYTWVGVAYMLTQTALQPLYGKLSDLVGRKFVLYASMAIFVAGSLCCGCAQSMLWLIIARGFAGVGGGGIVSLVWTITSEIVDAESRAAWSQALSVTWSCSAIAGPLLGGVFSVYLNLPVCLLAFGVIFISLHGIQVGCKTQTISWKKFGNTFDFLGLLLFMSGSSCVVVGFSFASTLGWRNPLTLVLIIGGPVVLIIGGFYETHTRRAALFPRPAFTDLTTIIILLINLLHNFAFNAGTYYLALYFQTVGGLSPLKSGVSMLPYSLGSSIASVPVAWFISYWQKQRCDISAQKYAISLGLAISALGFGLMKTMDGYTARALQVIFPLCAGVGLGMLFHAPYQVFLSALKPLEMASGTSAFFLVRFTGATVGLAVAGTAFDARLSTQLPKELGSSFDLNQLKSIMPLELRVQISQAVASSIQTIWLICAPCLTLAFVISIFVRTRVQVQRPTEEEAQEKEAKLPALQNSVIGETVA
ncbi:major facilitator superfamily domain-containing protein [Irpex rosettiformis]|uniref:Major facilitator superfamily domain-containing protein n=1 Tax=Irpex rosettiformis TaxID=378272 RepID=A0ACB8ULH9_9APHY|nr:major facilitator superfamily domain-containing protein [Irpex rosettiformis]